MSCNEISQGVFHDKIYQAVRRFNVVLCDEVQNAILTAKKNETSENGKNILSRICQNIELANQKQVPLCQDTGMIWALVEKGRDCQIDFDWKICLNKAVEEAYNDGCFRRSVVDEPLFERKNTMTNTPVISYLEEAPGNHLRISLLAKGFGSENTSRLAMLNPTAGPQGVIDFVCQAVTLAGGSPCPPIFLGIGIGGTMDYAAYLSKKALLRSEHSCHPDPRYQQLEKDIFAKVNQLGIGPGGLGGDTTCLGVFIESAPTHIAGLPVAITVNCWADRKITVVF